MGERCLRRPGSLRIIVNKPLVLRLTKDIIQTYQICNPTFTYSESFNPKRYLTNPSTGVLNKGLDNVNSDYILRVNAVLVNSDGNRRYIVKDLLGQGTFGQVVKCWCSETNNFVAVKVIKNQPAYCHQATIEISILTTLNQKFDPEDNHHIVRICDHFVFHGHLCIVFEMLGANLYELIKTNQFRGISLNLLKLFAKQILDSLLVLRDASVIHCDLKPENILLTTSMHSAEIKLIDFGSACMENETVYSYIQSRFYRSPEVVLGHPYTTAIDMWSFGCIAAELFLGLPLFPGASEYDLMRRMIERLGGQPPDQILRTARNTSKYFKHVGSFLVDESQEKGGQSAYEFLSESEYEASEKKKPASSKRYFNYVTLKDIILNYPHRKKMTKEELARENQIRLSFIDFLRGLVQFDPVKRWTPRQAAQHPFLTEQPFTGPYRPFPEAPHLHGCHGIMMDDNPAPSHGFGACCYPQVINTNLYAYDSSPRHQPTQFDQTGSCNSFENHHIHEEGFGFTNNCACKANTHIPMSYCPLASAAWNCQANAIPACLGQSPETWCRTIPIFQGQAEGVSTSNGVFRSMYFGVRPSRFHSSYQVQPSPSSPVKQGLDLTARDGMVMEENDLEQSAAIEQYHKMKGVGLLGNSHLSHQESVMPLGLVQSPYCVSQNLHKGSASYTDQNSHAEYLGSCHWDHESYSFQPSRQSVGINTNTGLPLAYDQKPSLPNCSVSKNILLTTEGMCSTGGGKSFRALNLGDWDSNYRNDLIFQEDRSDHLPPCSKSSECIRSEQDSYLTTSYVAGACRPVQSYIHVQGSPYRPDRLIEGQSDIKGSPTSVHGLEVGYTHPLTTIRYQGHNLSQQKSPSQRELQSSLFFKQQFQHPYDSKQNLTQHLPSNVMGMQHTCYPPDLYSQTTCISYSQVSAGKDAENSPGCLLPSQRDSQADYGQNLDFISSSKGFHDVSGINSFVPLRTTALHLVHLGQRNPLGDLPAAVHDIQYHKGTG